MIKRYSIHFRLLLAATLVLALFLGVGGVALDRAFQGTQEKAAEQRLMGHVYALLGAAEVDHLGRMRFPLSLPDPRFTNVDSGLYAEVVGEDGSYRWQSHSMTGRSLPPDVSQSTGKAWFRQEYHEGVTYYLLSYGILWEDDLGNDLTYQIRTAESDKLVQVQVQAFRKQLIVWLGGAAGLLLLVQGLVLTWGLLPLRQVSQDLEEVETGKASRLDGDYPRELEGLTLRINSLIRHNLDSRERYRNSLGDLAHSLKTPLAVLHGASNSDSDELKKLLSEQLPRMDEIIQFQLKRAATGGQSLGLVAPVEPVVTRLINTLEKVYADKQVSSRVDIEADLLFSGDEDDLLELLGNIIENAFKYGDHQVLVTASSAALADQGHLIRLTVEDDGPGVSQEVWQDVLQRGVRADQSISGQGIGLSISKDIIRLYKGTIQIDNSNLGGAKISVTLPISC